MDENNVAISYIVPLRVHYITEDIFLILEDMDMSEIFYNYDFILLLTLARRHTQTRFVHLWIESEHIIHLQLRYKTPNVIDDLYET